MKKTLKNNWKKLETAAYAERNFHQMILKKELPLTLGGGIGQSRVCMLFS
ncbi:hypothetical protein [Bacteroidetes bacterium endosymbiont of Geopemphigus sp.]|nr:hypothetical protein [Bacteroidetes bacterium endosymbiont of Geopemphigus sp.]